MRISENYVKMLIRISRGRSKSSVDGSPPRCAPDEPAEDWIAGTRRRMRPRREEDGTSMLYLLLDMVPSKGMGIGRSLSLNSIDGPCSGLILFQNANFYSSREKEAQT